MIDGGVNKHHHEFGGARVATGFNATVKNAGEPSTNDRMPADDPCFGFAIPPNPDYPVEQTNYTAETEAVGHGTAVASLVGGNRVGVAKEVTIVPVKVIRCDRYSARARQNSKAYQLHETMIRPTLGATAVATLYRVTTAGTTQATDPGNWPTTAGATKNDDSVIWEVVPGSHYANAQSTVMMLEALEWIGDETRNPHPVAGAVANMSMGRTHAEWGTGAVPVGTSVEEAIQRLVDEGLVVVASANNQNGNACDSIPARMSGVITVGGSMIMNRPWTPDISDVTGAEQPSPLTAGTADASDRYGTEPAFDSTKPVRDARWICGPGDSSKSCYNATSISTYRPTDAFGYNTWHGGSNAGPCVTLFAPAKNIPVASPAGQNLYRDPRVRDGHATGTSWSAPIVTGAVAHVIQRHVDAGNTQPLTPAQVKDALVADTIPALDASTLNTHNFDGNVITGTPNRLLRLGDVRITRGPVGSPSSGGTTLSVTGAGTIFSYTWYRVNADFDPVATRGAHPTYSSVQVGTNATFTVTTPGRYWVRVQGSCGSADSDIVTVTAPPVTQFTAKADSTTSIKLSWAAPSPSIAGVTYDLRYRTPANGAWSEIPGVSALEYRHTGLTAGVMYEYMVLAKGTSGVISAPVADYAVTRPFTDDPIQKRSASSLLHTRMKGVHIAELRQAVDAWRAFVGLPDAYTSYAAQTGRVYASHFTQLIAALNAARGRLGLPTFAYTNSISTPATGGRIKQEHVQELRLAIE